MMKQEIATLQASNTYIPYTLRNFRSLPQAALLSEKQKVEIEVVANVLPFKVNNYVANELIDWSNFQEDPMFILGFPQKDMLLPHHFDEISAALLNNAPKDELKRMVNWIRMELNPHPAGQMDLNVPELEEQKLVGIQHKYRETILFFPSQGQTCHAYCTFCFRWPQFVGMDQMKFAMGESQLLVAYLRQNPNVSDVLFTGGDALIVKTRILQNYIDALLEADLPNLQTIRLGTKALAFWPYRFTTDADADDLLRLFEKVVKKGVNLSIMAHFSHPVELGTAAVKEAISRIRSTGAQIRTQSPILRHINDSPEIWADMWRKQVNLNCIPYYMFVARDTGAQHYFAVPLVKAWDIFRNAYQSVSGVCRTVRGPSMSCTPGKVQILGVSEIPLDGKLTKIITLRFLQGRNPDWVGRPFFAEYDEHALWLNELKPAFGESSFFFEEELEKKYLQFAEA